MQFILSCKICCMYIFSSFYLSGLQNDSVQDPINDINDSESCWEEISAKCIKADDCLRCVCVKL